MDPDCQSDLITADVGFKWRPRNYLEAPNEPSRFRRYRLTPKANCELTTPKLPQSDHEDWFVNWDWQLDWMLKLGGVPELPTPANSKRLKKKYQKETELYAAAQMRKDSRNEAIVYWEAISRHLDEKEVARLKANDQLEEQINKNLALLAALRTIDTSTATGNELDDAIERCREQIDQDKLRLMVAREPLSVTAQAIKKTKEILSLRVSIAIGNSERVCALGIERSNLQAAQRKHDRLCDKLENDPSTVSQLSPRKPHPRQYKSLTTIDQKEGPVDPFQVHSFMGEVDIGDIGDRGDIGAMERAMYEFFQAEVERKMDEFFQYPRVALAQLISYKAEVERAIYEFSQYMVDALYQLSSYISQAVRVVRSVAVLGIVIGYTSVHSSSDSNNGSNTPDTTEPNASSQGDTHSARAGRQLGSTQQVSDHTERKPTAPPTPTAQPTSTGPLTTDLSVGFYNTGQESPEGWKCILYCYSIALKKLLLFGSVAPDPDQFDIMVRQWVTANGHPAHLNYDQTEITGQMLDAILLAANIPIERSVPSWCNHEKFQAMLTDAIAFSTTLSGEATAWSSHLSTLITQSMQVLCNRDLWRRIVTTNQELNVVVQEGAAEGTALGGLSGSAVADVMSGLIAPNVGSAKADTCCVIPVTVDESTELCEIPGSGQPMVDLHLFRSTADDDSVSPAGITPCKLNSGPHMAAKKRTVHGSVEEESRETKSDHVLVPKLEPVSRVSKRKGNWDWIVFDNEEWANCENRATCISRNPDQHPIGSTPEGRAQHNRARSERCRTRGDPDRSRSEPPEDVAGSSSTIAGSGSGSGSSNPLQSPEITMIGVNGRPHKELGDSVQSPIELARIHYRNSSYAAVIQSGYSVLVYAPCVSEEGSVRHVELSELESRGAKVIYAAHLQELDIMIKRLQPDILEPVRYRRQVDVRSSITIGRITYSQESKRQVNK